MGWPTTGNNVMDVEHKLFGRDVIQRNLERFLNALESYRKTFETEFDFDVFIQSSFALFKQYPDEFDAACLFNIEHIGNSFIGEVSGAAMDEEGYYDIFTSCYRFLSEFEFFHDSKAPDDLAREVARVLDKVRYDVNALPHRVRRQVVYADNFMPVALAKKYLSKPDFDLMREFDTKYSGLENVVTDLDTRLNNSKQEVNDLHATLKNYKDAFNFVGLHKGFNDMAKSKARSAYLSMIMMVFLFMLIIAPFCWKIWHLMTVEAPTGFNIELIVAFVGYDLLLLYFFRIVFHGYKSLKGQLVQLDLRKAVCQFIQSYAEYAVKIKGDNPALLEKFETLVFSGIVTNEDNIPSTFDGLEQMMKLYEKVKG
jgi:hypothetical protein